jgi:hypothetical protein
MAFFDEAGACVVSAVLLLGTSAFAATTTQKCDEAKLKAQGKLELCLQKNSAKVLGGKADMSAKCRMAFSAALTKADTKAGTPCRYIDNGDGTVSDLDTGLQWEKKDNLDMVPTAADPHDADNTYTWSAAGSAADGTAYTHFLSQLNNGLSTDGGAMTPVTGCFAGHCDWRLPSIVELQGIEDHTQGSCGGGSGPCIDPVFGPTTIFAYWSATSDAGNSFLAWNVDPPSVSEVGKTNLLYLRAVRGGL